MPSGLLREEYSEIVPHQIGSYSGIQALVVHDLVNFGN